MGVLVGIGRVVASGWGTEPALHDAARNDAPTIPRNQVLKVILFNTLASSVMTSQVTKRLRLRTGCEPHMPRRAAQTAISGPRLQQRYEWLSVAAEPYSGFKLRLWTNYPPGLAREVYSGDTERTLAALLQIVAEHNGWHDHAGLPYPPATTREFWDAIPNELFRLILLAIDAAPGLLAGSLNDDQVVVRGANRG